MKCKISKGAGFRGLVNYAQKEDAIFIASSTGAESKDFLRQCAKLRESRPDIKKPVLHFSLSLPPPERLNKEGWGEAIAKFQTEMGLEGHDYFAVQHTDADHDHVHLIVSKISPNGDLWKDGNDVFRAMSACEKIEKDMCLTITKTLKEFREETGQKRQPMRDTELQMMARTGTAGSRRKAAITAKIAAERASKNGTENKPASTDGIANKRGNQQWQKNPRPAPGGATGSSQSYGKNGSALGKIRVASFQNRAGQVVFKIANKPVARLTADRQQIEVFSLDEQAIDFAISQAVKSGQVPLQIYGTPEFIIAAEALAKARGVPVAQHFPESGSGQNQPLTPTPTTPQGTANAYRELRITDPIQASPQRPPTRNGRVRTLSEIAVVQRGRTQVLLPRDALVHLDINRADTDQGVRRIDDQNPANTMNTPEFKRLEALVEERRSQLPPPIQTPAKTAPKSVGEPQYIESPRPTSAPAPRPKF